MQDQLRKERIEDVATLRLLTRADLRDLGLRVGDSRKLMSHLGISDDVCTTLVCETNATLLKRLLSLCIEVFSHAKHG
jgi:hypothetical protein